MHHIHYNIQICIFFVYSFFQYAYWMIFVCIFTSTNARNNRYSCLQGALLCCLTLSYVAARPCRICWVTNEQSKDPLVTAKRRTVKTMKRKTELPFQILSGQSRQHSRMWANAELKKISAKALRPSTWDASFGDSPWGKYAYYIHSICY